MGENLMTGECKSVDVNAAMEDAAMKSKTKMSDQMFVQCRNPHKTDLMQSPKMKGMGKDRWR